MWKIAMQKYFTRTHAICQWRTGFELLNNKSGCKAKHTYCFPCTASIMKPNNVQWCCSLPFCEYSHKAKDDELPSEQKVKRKAKSLKVTSKKDLLKKSDRTKQVPIQQLVKDVGKELHPRVGQKNQRQKAESDLLKRINKMFSHSTSPKNKKGVEKEKEVAMLFKDANIVRRDSANDDPRDKTRRTTDVYTRASESSGNPFRLSPETTGRLNVFQSGRAEPEELALPSDTSTWTAIDWYDKYEADALVNVFDCGNPSNDFEQHIIWTEQEKLWSFPIDNEQGMEEEQSVSFYEHVFLEKKVQEGNWCPAKGPIRLFMTSVATALSMNPYLTVEEKHEHIDWFREYFIEKLSILQELQISLPGNDAAKS